MVIRQSEQAILEQLKLARGAYVSTVALADSAGFAPRTARHYLRQLEALGITSRCAFRSGWRLVRPTPPYTVCPGSRLKRE